MTNHIISNQTIELPLPEQEFRKKGIGSRSTFHRWEKLGLRVTRVGRRRFIRPSDLASFLDHQAMAAIDQNN